MDFNCIKRMDLVMSCATSNGKPVKGTERSVCILYNTNTITTEEVYNLVNNGIPTKEIIGVTNAM